MSDSREMTLAEIDRILGMPRARVRTRKGDMITFRDFGSKPFARECYDPSPNPAYGTCLEEHLVIADSITIRGTLSEEDKKHRELICPSTPLLPADLAVISRLASRSLIELGVASDTHPHDIECLSGLIGRVRIEKFALMDCIRPLGNERIHLILKCLRDNKHLKSFTAGEIHEQDLLKIYEAINANLKDFSHLEFIFLIPKSPDYWPILSLAEKNNHNIMINNAKLLSANLYTYCSARDKGEDYESRSLLPLSKAEDLRLLSMKRGNDDAFLAETSKRPCSSDAIVKAKIAKIPMLTERDLISAYDSGTLDMRSFSTFSSFEKEHYLNGLSQISRLFFGSIFFDSAVLEKAINGSGSKVRCIGVSEKTTPKQIKYLARILGSSSSPLTIHIMDDFTFNSGDRSAVDVERSAKTREALCHLLMVKRIKSVSFVDVDYEFLLGVVINISRGLKGGASEYHHIEKFTFSFSDDLNIDLTVIENMAQALRQLNTELEVSKARATAPSATATAAAATVTATATATTVGEIALPPSFLSASRHGASSSSSSSSSSRVAVERAPVDDADCAPLTTDSSVAATAAALAVGYSTTPLMLLSRPRSHSSAVAAAAERKLAR